MHLILLMPCCNRGVVAARLLLGRKAFQNCLIGKTGQPAFCLVTALALWCLSLPMMPVMMLVIGAFARRYFILMVPIVIFSMSMVAHQAMLRLVMCAWKAKKCFAMPLKNLHRLWMKP